MGLVALFIFNDFKGFEIQMPAITNFVYKMKLFCNITTKRKVTFKKWSCIKVKGVIHYHLKRQRADSQKKRENCTFGKIASNLA